MEYVIQCIAAFFGCFGFSFIFRIHKHIHHSIYGSIVGAIGWIIYLALGYTKNVYLQSFMAMLFVALASEFLARLCKAPATIFIMLGFFPLVPGSGIYYTMLYAVRGQPSLFIDSLLSTLGIAMSLSFAILISSTIIKVFRRIKRRKFDEIE